MRKRGKEKERKRGGEEERRKVEGQERGSKAMVRVIARVIDRVTVMAIALEIGIVRRNSPINNSVSVSYIPNTTYVSTLC